ncbi:hypothetical protein MIND_00905500 [Mycena indigotica]|uniref:F-box domain-containing protein n=1 Tax=Mycena indigotica TaxID=2126181 RepID=A0A8H6SC87_9AGAR|nr:uncharacterized protein MIND_00905500 [Mycena indigotica]KAF7296749.1 hypothetical protein MIND_00905500 [Mycena indigotica]
MVPPLPPELIALIIDNLHTVRTLKSCSLVADVFRQPAQRKLYRHFTVRIEYIKGAFDCSLDEELVAHLLASPHLARYVVSFTLSAIIRGGSWELEPITRRLATLFKHLSNVAALNISVDSLAWTRNSPLTGTPLITFTMAIERFIRDQAATRTLRQLGVSSFSKVPVAFITHILMACPTVAIRHLRPSLQLEYPDNNGFPLPMESTGNTRLCRLKAEIFDISHPEPPVHQLMIPHVKFLRTLVATGCSPMSWDPRLIASYLHDLCSAASATLVHLSIELPAQGQRDPPPPFRLPRLPHLQYLQIKFHMSSQQDDKPDAPSLTHPAGLLALLSLFLISDAFPVLSELCLRPDMFTGPGYDSSSHWDRLDFRSISMPPCHELDNIIVGLPVGVSTRCVPRFCHWFLGYVKETFPMDSPLHHQRFGMYAQALPAALPKATAQGLKIINYHAGAEWREEEVEFCE